MNLPILQVGDVYQQNFCLQSMAAPWLNPFKDALAKESIYLTVYHKNILTQ